jgi:TPP-dependent pyruvate/acetoin dehydrogenase alpha subunit
VSVEMMRRCEEAIGRLLNEGLVHGTAHLSIGQEAVPVGLPTCPSVPRCS